jgi:hypothetical protein
MSPSSVSDGSGPGGKDLWDRAPLEPGKPPTEPAPDEIRWSRPETLRSGDVQESSPAPPPSRPAAKGRPVKKAAKKSTARRTRR